MLITYTADELQTRSQNNAEDDQDLGTITATFYWVQGIHKFDPVGDYSETARLTYATKNRKLDKGRHAFSLREVRSFTDDYPSVLADQHLASQNANPIRKPAEREDMKKVARSSSLPLYSSTGQKVGFEILLTSSH